MDKLQEAMAIAFRHAKAKSLKIKELGITPDMSADAIDEMIVKLAKAKNTNEWESQVKGQRWYVEDLVKFSGMKPQEKMDYEYAQAFPDIAGEDEMVAALAALA